MKATDVIKNIALPAPLPAVDMSRLPNNLHVHLPPNFSAFDNIQQVVDLAAAQEIKVLGVTNYYYHDVYDKYALLAKQAGIFPVFGLEIISQIDELQRRGVRINDPGNPGRMYLCGKGVTSFDDPPERARELLNFIRKSDAARMAEMIAKVAAIFAQNGVPNTMTADTVIDMIAERHSCPKATIGIQERHIAMAFQRMFFEKVAPADRAAALKRIFGVNSKAAPDDAVAIQGEIRSHLMKAGKPAFVVEKFVSQQEAYELILALGGIPCYPVLADGSPVPCQYEEDVETLVKRLSADRIYCAEFIPERNKPAALRKYVKGLRAAGIVVVAGTEHNTLDLIPLEPRCAGNEEIDAELKDIFWEGACVVAAHQFLCLNGKTGFVDARGELNPNYGSKEERIKEFSRLGAALIKNKK
ncbi:MAG: hypothetical protein PHV59_05985 [Victivallales bacterium]|nr:hypothetical protein [Victivallales bacterium]